MRKKLLLGLLIVLLTGIAYVSARAGEADLCSLYSLPSGCAGDVVIIAVVLIDLVLLAVFLKLAQVLYRLIRHELQQAGVLR